PKGKTLLICCGNIGSKASLPAKPINVPEYCFKVIVVLSKSPNSPTEISSRTVDAVIAVKMPNSKFAELDESGNPLEHSGLQSRWQDHLATITDIENTESIYHAKNAHRYPTYHFFSASNLPA